MKMLSVESNWQMFDRTHVVSVTSSHLETDAGGDEKSNRPLLPQSEGTD